MSQKRSFLERLTGSIRMEEDEPVVMSQPIRKQPSLYRGNLYNSGNYNHEDEEIYTEESITIETQSDSQESEVAELAIDLYETNDCIVIKAMTAGVKKEDLQIVTTRETLTLQGRRENDTRGYQNEYHIQELYWGQFSRTVNLPVEIDIEGASAVEHHGLVTIKLPKIDKKQQTSIKVQ